MKLPQLVQEIIDYYRWKAKIVRCNRELKTTSKVMGDVAIRCDGIFLYGWRDIERGNKSNFLQFVFHNNYNTTRSKLTFVQGKLPSRYFYSNTKEQLKSLYF